MITLDHDLDTIHGGALPTCAFDPILGFVCTGDTGPFEAA